MMSVINSRRIKVFHFLLNRGKKIVTSFFSVLFFFYSNTDAQFILLGLQPSVMEYFASTY